MALYNRFAHNAAKAVSYNPGQSYNPFFIFAKENTKELNEILDTDDGARYIGEFAFGLNPYITNTICDTLFDEKISGSFHLTPGMALEESDNGNRSAIHWDIVKILRKEFGGSKIYFDDILIMKDGEFILEDLKNLNVENLK